MNNIFYYAEKGLVLDQTKTKLLAVKFTNSKYNAAEAIGKFGLPGGKLEFGEQPIETFLREIYEETGLKVKLGRPFYSWTWIYPKGHQRIQIIALARLADYESGEIINHPTIEKETILDQARWLEIKTLKPEDFISDEQPVIQKFLEYYHKKIRTNS